MRRPPSLTYRLVLVAATLATFLSGCFASGPVATTTPTPRSETPEPATPTSTPVPPPSPTALPPRVILLIPEEADPTLAAGLERTLEELAAASGLRLERQAALAPEELAPDVRLVVALPPDSGLADLASAAPGTQFLAIGIPDLQPGANLSMIGPGGLRPDQQAFAAGYLAAVITPQYRVGVLSRSDTPTGRAARQGFLNGAVFYCGLCRPNFPPFFQYPLFFELPADAGPEEVQSAVEALLEKSVRTMYLGPGAAHEPLLAYLGASGVNWIASGLPSGSAYPNLVAVVRPDPTASLRELWPELLAGRGGVSMPIPITLDQVNPELLSPGRQRLVQAFLLDLKDGALDTGVDPLTGDPR